jgi:MoaA/NifB/PqqE/SkfB family radical SAM enzyme
LISNVSEIIVSLDGDEQTHDAIRNIPGAYSKLKEGVQFIKSISPTYRISGRTVIHQLNFRKWLNIIDSAKEIGLNNISFLPADISSHAFNREQLWDANRQGEIMLKPADLPEMKIIIQQMISEYKNDFEKRFIAESEEKIMNIYRYYSAFYQLNPFPYKKCNAPWVSAVVEADGSVRPCFFHPAMGNIHDDALTEIVNSRQSLAFRKSLDMARMIFV